MKKTFKKVLTVLSLVATLVSVFAISSSAFAYESIKDFDINYVGGNDTYTYYTENMQLLNLGTVYQLIEDGVPVGSTLAWGDYYYHDGANHLFSAENVIDFGKRNAIEFMIVESGGDNAIVHRDDCINPDNQYAWKFNSGLFLSYRSDGLRLCFTKDFKSAYGGNTTYPEGDYTLVMIVYYDDAFPQGNINDGYADYEEMLLQYEALLDDYQQLTLNNEELQFRYDELEELYNSITDTEDYKDLEYYKTCAEEYKKDLEAYKQKYQEAKEGMENSNAILNFFTGIYDTIHGVLGDFFGIEVMGFSVGGIVGIVVICSVLFFVIKLFI